MVDESVEEKIYFGNVDVTIDAVVGKPLDFEEILNVIKRYNPDFTAEVKDFVQNDLDDLRKWPKVHQFKLRLIECKHYQKASVTISLVPVQILPEWRRKLWPKK